MEEKEINPNESLAVINAMIHTAKNKLANDGFHQIFWGWLITFCAMTHYITLKMDLNWGGLVWVIFPPLGAIFSTVYGRRHSRAKKVTTYIDTYLRFLWGAFLIGLTVVLLFIGEHGIKNTYFMLMILYGIATFVTGGILNFRPLIYGSLFSFAFAILSVFLSDIDQFVCISGALIFSHVIPGHMLRSQYQSENV